MLRPFNKDLAKFVLQLQARHSLSLTPPPICPSFPCLSHKILPSPFLSSQPSPYFRFQAGTGSSVGGARRRKTLRSRDSAVAAVPVPATDRRGFSLKVGPEAGGRGSPPECPGGSLPGPSGLREGSCLQPPPLPPLPRLRPVR